MGPVYYSCSGEEARWSLVPCCHGGELGGWRSGGGGCRFRVEPQQWHGREVECEWRSLFLDDRGVFYFDMAVT